MARDSRSLHALHRVVDRRAEIVESAAIEVLIPVYGRLDAFRKCLASVVDQSIQVEVRVVVLDDGMDAASSRLIKNICESTGVELWRSDSNLGFRRIVNLGFALTQAEWVLLLNSDTVLGHSALEEMLAVGRSDSLIALVSPFATNGSPLEVELEPGQNWRELSNELFREDRARSIDACTTVGYCLLLRRESVTSEELFDGDLPDAYGEDTDLHFRLTSVGWRAVVASRVFIHHEGSGTYGRHEAQEHLVAAAKSHFDARWRTRWEEEFPEFISSLDREIGIREGRQLSPVWKAHRDVVFVSPGHDHRANGGVATIWALADATSESSPLTSVVSLQLGSGDEPPWDGAPLRACSMGRVATARVVVATAPWTWHSSATLAARSRGDIVTFMQGLDFYMDPRSASSYLEMIRASSAVITTSDYLEECAWRFGANRVIRVSIGPDPLVFVPRLLAPHWDVVVIGRETGLKGSEIGRGSAALLAALGYRVALLGVREGISLPGVECIPWMDKWRISEVLSRSRVVFDPSNTEGFGLMPREAAAMGCAVIGLRSGGAEEGLTGHAGYRALGRPADPAELIDAVDRLIEWHEATPLSRRVLRPVAEDFGAWTRWLDEELNLAPKRHRREGVDNGDGAR